MSAAERCKEAARRRRRAGKLTEEQMQEELADKGYTMEPGTCLFANSLLSLPSSPPPGGVFL